MLPSATFWPRAAGWFTVQSGRASQTFNVRAAGEAPGLHARILGEQTQRLVIDAPEVARSSVQPPRIPGARWPWWLAWLLFSAALWWFERSRLGTAIKAPSPHT